MTVPFDPTKPVQTRGGCKARILSTDLKNADGYSIVAVITDRYGDEYAWLFLPNGHINKSECPDDWGLVNVPEVEMVHGIRARDGSVVSFYRNETQAKHAEATHAGSLYEPFSIPLDSIPGALRPKFK